VGRGGACPSEVRNQLARKRRKDHHRTLSQNMAVISSFFSLFLGVFRLLSAFLFSILSSLQRKAVARIVADGEAQMFTLFFWF
jgi:hypothetical protein